MKDIRIIFSIVFCLLFLPHMGLFGETTSTLGYELEKIHPQTPVVAEYLKFGEYQMDYSTGVPNIEIPIYNIKLKNFTLPISIKYHASGIKVQELSSCVGLGWALSAGGCISVEVKGIRDKTTSIGANSESEFYSKNLNTIKDMLTHGIDTERDTYHYSFPGHGGIFRYSQPNDTIRTLPYKPIKIEQIGQSFYDKGFKITDEDGNIYWFTLKETMQVDTEHVETCAWHLTKIQPSQSNDSIVFKYKFDLEASKYIKQFSSYFVLPGYIPPAEGSPESYEDSYGFCNRSRLSSIRTDTYVLDSILWQGNSIAFEYQNRLDGFDTEGNGWLKLTSVSVKNMLGHIVQRTHLNHSYRQKEGHNWSKRLMLDSINVNGSRYSFEYNNTNLPNYVNIHDMSCYEDMWGFYKGDHGFESLDCWFPGEFSSHSYLDNQFNRSVCPLRMPNENYCKAMMLERITYPTGGYTLFEYEPNTYEPDTSWGGLRLYSYSNFQSDGTLSEQKTYKYGFATPPDDITGMSNNYMMPKEHLFFRDIPANLCNREINSFPDDAAYQHKEFRGSPVLPITEGGAPIHYLYVQELDGNESNYQRKTLYEYKRCTVDVSELVSNNDHRTESIILWNKTYNYDQGNPSYELARKRIYKRVHNIDSLIYDENNSFLVDSVAVYKAGVRVSQIIIREGRNSNPLNYITDEGTVKYDYSVSDVCIIPTYSLLTSNSIEQDGILKTESYSYDGKLRTLRPKSTQVLLSDGKIQNTIFTYPFDDTEYNEMFNANMQTPIKEQTFVDGNCVYTKETEYEYKSSLWLPKSVNIGYGHDTETKVRYINNNKGNIVCSIKNETIYENYIYGYNGTLPVAIIESDTFLNCSDIEETGEALKSRLSEIRQMYESDGCLVSTYMYEPLVGITWHQDQNRNIKMYEYDNKGRLIGVSDGKNHQESLYEYNLKN